jgi:hypothetical protein
VLYLRTVALRATLHAQFNSSRNRAISPGQALGTALRNHADPAHPDSGTLSQPLSLSVHFNLSTWKILVVPILS